MSMIVRRRVAIPGRIIQNIQCSSTVAKDMKAHDFRVTDQDVDEVNAKYVGILQIQPNQFGRGLFADRKYIKGDMIMSANAVSVKSERDSHSVQTDWNKHVIMDLPAILINHNCNANTGIRDNEKGAFDFFALCDINRGDELVWDYEAAEYIIDGFQCSCGSCKCRHSLGGFHVNRNAIMQQYGKDYIAKYLQGK